MGGHGGLNILPQKRWNVYNFDNREKVRRDEEEAAKEEQLEQEQARKREAESRLERLRSRARGSDPLVQVTTTEAVKIEAVTPAVEPVESESQPKSDSNHINLFEGIKIFDVVEVGGVRKRGAKEEEEGSKKKKMKKEDAPRVVGPEDEVYRLGYGIAGKGVKAPWYLTKPSMEEEEEKERSSSAAKEEKKEAGKRKSLEELREERLKRENKEKQRVRALMMDKRVVQKSSHSSKDRGYYRR